MGLRHRILGWKRLQGLHCMGMGIDMVVKRVLYRLGHRVLAQGTEYGVVGSKLVVTTKVPWIRGTWRLSPRRHLSDVLLKFDVQVRCN